jgi:peptide/nickel transport system ATP-binding protein
MTTTPDAPAASADPRPLLDIRNLKTWFHTDEGIVKAVDDISLQIGPGETLGLVGESGSGKSVTSLTIMRLLPESSSEIAGGSVAFLGKDLATMSLRDMCDIRGQDVAMIFQEPMTSLNPVFRVGDQVAETILAHQKVTRDEARVRTIQLFREVGIPDPEERIDSYPHEMSGGQKQRVMIAMALACNPKLLIADEPTTALDVTIQAQILDLLRDLRDRRGMSILFITHDLGVIAEIADKVAVMYRGKLVEYGDVLSVFGDPKHPYTKGLLACRPRLDTPYRILPTVDDFMETWVEHGEVKVREKPMSWERLKHLTTTSRPRMIEPSGEPILKVQNLKVWFPVKKGLLGGPTRHIKAVDDVSFDVYPGQTLGLVGESGCGKTTTGRAILRLIEPTAGRVWFQGEDLATVGRSALNKLRRHLQNIFQDPYSSLNPRQTVEEILTEPMLVHGIGKNHTERRDRAQALMTEVGLPPTYLRRYPHEFSGGQRQRIVIARALSVEPKLVICDEAVSALDVSVQAQVLNLLKQLQERRNLTYIFISHDLAVVKFMSDVMCVMQGGKIVEMGPAEAIYAKPREEYTKNLIAAIPRDDIAHIREIQSVRRRVTQRHTPVHEVTAPISTTDPGPDAEPLAADEPGVPVLAADTSQLVFYGLDGEDQPLDGAPALPAAALSPAEQALVRRELGRDSAMGSDDFDNALDRVGANAKISTRGREELARVRAWMRRSNKAVAAWRLEERR